MNAVLPEIHIKLGPEQRGLMTEQLFDYVNENPDDVVHAITALRYQRHTLYEALKKLSLTISNMHDLFGGNPAGEWLMKTEAYKDGQAAIALAEQE